MADPTAPLQTQGPSSPAAARDMGPPASLALPQRALLLVGNRVRARQVLDEMQRHGMDVHLLWSTVGAAEVLTSVRPDVVVADVLSFGDSREAASALQTLRAAAPQATAPVLLLLDHEALGQWDLLLAADDFILEPVRAAEVVARAALLALRANQRGREGTLLTGRLTLDFIGRRVLVDGREVYLTHREFELVRFLVMHRGRVVTREMVRQHLWGAEAEESLRTVDVHIRRIRSKLERDGTRFIETVRNVGYKFVGG